MKQLKTGNFSRLISNLRKKQYENDKIQRIETMFLQGKEIPKSTIRNGKQSDDHNKRGK